MARGRKYSREEWDAAVSLRKMGKKWGEIGAILGRGENGRCAEIFRKYESYEDYDRAVSRRGERRTEQLQFLPPELPKKEPRKIEVKAAISDDELMAYKLRRANRQAVAIKNFITELKDAGFKVKLG